VNIENSISIAVENATGYELPETGGSGTYLFTFGGLLTIMSALVYFALHNERKCRKGVVYRQD